MGLRSKLGFRIRRGLRCVILWVVSPVLHKLPVDEEEVKITDPPAQKVVLPVGVIVGVDGNAFTVTTVEEEVAEQPLSFLTVTLYEPPVITVILCVVAFVLHK